MNPLLQYIIYYFLIGMSISVITGFLDSFTSDTYEIILISDLILFFWPIYIGVVVVLFTALMIKTVFSKDYTFKLFYKRD